MFKDLPLCEGSLSQEHKKKLEVSLGYLSQFLNNPGDWGYETKLGVLCTAVKQVLSDVKQAKTD